MTASTRAIYLSPGQRLSGLPFGSPAEHQFVVRDVVSQDASMVRITAVSTVNAKVVSVNMRQQRKLQIPEGA